MAGNVREGKILNINPAFAGLFKKTRILSIVDTADIVGNRGLLYNNESMIMRANKGMIGMMHTDQFRIKMRRGPWR